MSLNRRNSSNLKTRLTIIKRFAALILNKIKSFFFPIFFTIICIMSLFLTSEASLYFKRTIFTPMTLFLTFKTNIIHIFNLIINIIFILICLNWTLFLIMITILIYLTFLNFLKILTIIR